MLKKNKIIVKTDKKAVIYDLAVSQFFNFLASYNFVDYNRILDSNNPDIYIKHEKIYILKLKEKD